MFALAQVLGKSMGGCFYPSSMSLDKTWPFLRKNVITLFPPELQAMVEVLSYGPDCLLRKLSFGNNIYLMVSSSMENTAKTFGNTNTSIFPLQTRKRGASQVGCRAWWCKPSNSSTRKNSQEDLFKVKASLGYRVRFCAKQTNKQNEEGGSKGITGGLPGNTVVAGPS